MDECGRGSLAGPLVAGAVVFKTTNKRIIEMLNAPLRDSKKLTRLARSRVFAQKDELPIVYKFESVTVAEINQQGIAWANKQIFLRLASKIKADQYIVDGNIKFESPLRSIVHGDNKRPQIMLASILAKVYRDNMMRRMHRKFPLYHWNKNAGYGSREHLDALRRFGPVPPHRLLYVRSTLGLSGD